MSKSKKVVKKPEPVAVPTVSFETWWVLASKRGNFRPYLKEIMAADFKGRGLSENETLDCYYEALRQFGYTV